MPDISFTSFNPRSFEQFAQALAGSVLGQGLLVFGDGPDGGREASFVGKVPYPSIADQWDGHIVIQAKYHLHLTRDGRDADWLVAQIAGEADRVASITPPPSYYIVVTNVRLSGVRGRGRKGGQQKIEEAFTKHLSPLGVKAMHIWHEEKIATLLDHEPELLRSYGAWLSSREVLASVFESLSDKVPDFESTILRLLMRELREQRATRLQQAGHVDEAATPLESVFVDLPYGAPLEGVEARMELLGELRPSNGTGGLLADLLALTSLKLDPLTVAHGFPDHHGPAPVRHLVLGGPGQGKSTISQFLAQVARARLLHDQPAHRLTAEVRPVLDAIRHRMNELGLPIDGPRRYPLRVDLPVFADALSNAERSGGSLSLLEHLAVKISTAATAPVDAAVMRRWLKAYPWLLILDGLDEVPPSGNRARLLAAITDFWDEATPVNADVAMVITTRPQGYNDDLDPRVHMRHEMQKLDPDRALAYAHGVAAIKIQEVDRRERVLARMRAAAENSTTALLMVSPLQVAILLQLVDQRGSAPTDRWTLFAEYLSVVIKREQEKQGEAGRVVKDRAFVIDGMLRRAGLLLHVESERQGGAQAYLTIERLRELARDVLVEEGHEGDVLDLWAAEITDAATDRLVFLEQRVEGQVEFDVRSLQEFMAAAELMGGDDSQVRERLQAIAGQNHWQHVYRIAASKAFSNRDAAKYRETVVTANLMLETEDLAARATRRGGALALELLADGVAHDQPKFRRMLIEQAASLLELGPRALDPRLAEALRTGTLHEGVELLTPRLSSASEDERLAAWEVLFRLVGEKGDAADQTAAEHWPADSTMRLGIAAGTTPPLAGTGADALVRDAFAYATPIAASEALALASRGGMGRINPTLAARLPYLTSVSGGADALQLDVGVLERGHPTMRLKLITVEGARRANSLVFPDVPEWRMLMPITMFVEEPTIESLAVFVEALSNSAVKESAINIAMPWVLQTALTMVRFGRDPQELAAEIRIGGMADPASWEKAEARWRSDGIVEGDLNLWREGTFFDERVSLVGAPYSHYISLSMGGRSDGEWLMTVIRKLVDAVEAGPAFLMRRIAIFALGESFIPKRLSAEEMIRLVDINADTKWQVRAGALGALCSDALADPELVGALAIIGERNGFAAWGSGPSFDVAAAVTLIRRELGPGLLELACALFADKQEDLTSFACEITADLARVDAELEGPAAILLKYMSGLATLSDALAASTCDGRENAQQHALLTLAKHAATPESDAEEILVALVTRLNRPSTRVRNDALGALRRVLDQRTSELHDVSTWKQLGLPLTVFSMIRQDAP